MTAREDLLIVADLEGDAEESLKAIGRETKKMADKAERNFERVEKDAKEMGRSVEQSTGAMKVAGVAAFGAIGAAAAAASAAAIARFGFSFIEMASQAEDAQAKFDTVFRGMEESANETAAELSEAFGRNLGDIQSAMSGFQDLFVPIGLASDDAAILSERITALAIDLASFNGIADDEAITALSSALVGSHETVKRFGVIINDARIKQEAFELGINKTTSELTEQEKVLIRARILFEDTTAAQGDVERTSDSWRNTTKRLTAELESMREEIGAELMDEVLELIDNIGGMETVVGTARLAVVGIGEAFKTLLLPIEEAGGAFQGFIDTAGGFERVELQIKTFFLSIRLGIQDTIESFRKLDEVLALISPNYRSARLALDALVTDMDSGNSVFTTATELYGNFQRALETGEGPYKALIAYNEFRAGLTPLELEMADLAERLFDLDNTFDFTADGAGELGGALEELAGAASDAAGAGDGDDGGGAGGLASVGDEIAGMIEELNELQEETDETGRVFGDLGPKLYELFQFLQEARDQAGETTKSFGDLGVKLYELFQFMQELEETDMGGDAGGGQFTSALAETVRATSLAFDDLFAGIVAGGADSKEAWSDFSNFFLRQAAAMIVKALLLKALGVNFAGTATTGGGLFNAMGISFGQADGGILSGTAMANGGVLPFQAFASGGVVNEPTLALMGENPFFKGEAFVPLPDGKKIPVEGAGGATVNFNVSAADARSFDTMLVERRDTLVGVIREATIRDRSFRSAMGAAR